MDSIDLSNFFFQFKDQAPQWKPFISL